MAIDSSGYTGNLMRQRQSELGLIPLKFDELVSMFTTNNKMLDIMRRINEIDREHNGYVTSTELDDIVRLAYGKELTGKSLKQLFRPYSSIQNKILIDYKRFRDDLLKGVERNKAEENLKVINKSSADVL